MLRRTKSKSVVDLTPLLDVVLILLFALLMSMSFEQDAYKAEASKLDEELKATQLEKDALTTLIDEQKDQMAVLEQNINTLDEQNKILDEAVITWFASEDIRNKELVTSEDFKEIFDKDKTNQSLYQMDFIANQFFFVEIEFDTENLHQVIVNGKSTNIQLTFEKRGDQTQLDLAYNELYDALEKELVSNKGGFSFVLFTLKDNGKVYKYAYDLVWGVIKDIEKSNKEQTIYKLQYLDY